MHYQPLGSSQLLLVVILLLFIVLYSVFRHLSCRRTHARNKKDEYFVVNIGKTSNRIHFAALDE